MGPGLSYRSEIERKAQPTRPDGRLSSLVGGAKVGKKRVCTVCTPWASDQVVLASDWAGLAMIRGNGGKAFLVRQDLDVGKAGMVNDGDMDVVETEAVAVAFHGFAAAVDPPAASLGDIPELLHVPQQQTTPGSNYGPPDQAPAPIDARTHQ